VISGGRFLAAFSGHTGAQDDPELFQGIVRGAARMGFALLFVKPDSKEPLCPLTSRALKLADTAAQEAAREAGHPRWDRARHDCGRAHATDDPKALNLLGVSAFSVWHQPKVQAAIKEFGEQCVLAGLVPLAFVALENALKMGDVKEQTKAAQIVMDRTGFHAKSETIVRQPDKDRVAQIREIVRLCKLQGLDPRTLIGGAVDFVDADFEVIDGKKPELKAITVTADAVEPEQPVGTTKGLEDLL